MIAAALIMPAMTARMMTDNFSRMQLYSIAIGIFIGTGGMYLSYFLNVSSGATIVLFGALVFCLSVLIKNIREKSILRANLHRHGNLIHSHPRDDIHRISNSTESTPERKKTDF